MELNRLPVNYPSSTPIGRCPELTSTEKAITNSMLEGVLKNWEKLKSTSITGLREGFYSGKVVWKRKKISTS